jgi:hypothetical protein
MWTYEATNQSAAAVATVFAAKHFGEPREVENVRGSWLPGGRYVGRFNLVDGVRDYEILGERGRWIVKLAEGAE